MNRKIPNRPHPTPNPDKPHAAGGPDRTGLARAVTGSHATQGHSSPAADLETEMPNYDSCFDDLNAVLAQSINQPDPDPNLESAGEGPHPPDADDSTVGAEPVGRGQSPRTSEIFRSVIGPGTGAGVSSSPADHDAPQGESAAEAAIADLGVVDRRPQAGDATAEEGPQPDGSIPWGQVLLLSYSSALTLALIWMFWTGRIPMAAAPAPGTAEKPAAESPPRSAATDADASPPPVPRENLANIGQTVRIGDLEVTPMAIEAVPVELVRTIDPDKRRRERDCLVLRLRLRNRSNDQTFTPVNLNVVRERDLRSIDPYIETSDGQRIRLFPLALDSEWSILGQEFPTLPPGEESQTFVAAEPGSAGRLADEMTWRVRLRTGVYRVDMLGVKFTRAQVRRPRAGDWDERG
jgi:hypothetical protein